MTDQSRHSVALRFLLTSLLLPRLEQSEEARIVHVSAKAHERMPQIFRPGSVLGPFAWQVGKDQCRGGPLEAEPGGMQGLVLSSYCARNFDVGKSSTWNSQRGIDSELTLVNTCDVCVCVDGSESSFVGESFVSCLTAWPGKCACWETWVARMRIRS